MNTFRAFILDANNRIIRSEVLAVSTMDEAVAAATPLATENDLEVWLGSRRLATIRKGGVVEPAENGSPDEPRPS